MKLPSFQFYPGDWRKDPGVQALSFEMRGIWLEILLLMHESDQRGKLLLNGKKMPEEALARLLGLPSQQLSRTISTILEFGVASVCPETGALMNRRMVRDDETIKRRREAGGKGAEHGIKGASHGKEGGRPKADNPPKTPLPPKKETPLKPPPSSSSSSSSSSSVKEREKDIAPEDFPMNEILAALGRATDFLSLPEQHIAKGLINDGCTVADFSAAFAKTKKRGVSYNRNAIREAKDAREKTEREAAERKAWLEDDTPTAQPANPADDITDAEVVA